MITTNMILLLLLAFSADNEEPLLNGFDAVQERQPSRCTLKKLCKNLIYVILSMTAAESLYMKLLLTRNQIFISELLLYDNVPELRTPADLPIDAIPEFRGFRGSIPGLGNFGRLPLAIAYEDYGTFMSAPQYTWIHTNAEMNTDFSLLFEHPWHFGDDSGHPKESIDGYKIIKEEEGWRIYKKDEPCEYILVIQGTRRGNSYDFVEDAFAFATSFSPTHLPKWMPWLMQRWKAGLNAVDIIKDLKGESCKAYITGHSLGGGVAINLHASNEGVFEGCNAFDPYIIDGLEILSRNAKWAGRFSVDDFHEKSKQNTFVWRRFDDSVSAMNPYGTEIHLGPIQNGLPFFYPMFPHHGLSILIGATKLRHQMARLDPRNGWLSQHYWMGGGDGASFDQKESDITLVNTSVPPEKQIYFNDLSSLPKKLQDILIGWFIRNNIYTYLYRA